jgi:hypothetical protein
MSFENIKNVNFNAHERSCMVLVNFNMKESNNIKNVARLIGIKDIINVDYKNGQTTINDILENNIKQNDDLSSKNKVILFNNIPIQKINGLLDNLKKIKINRPLSAMITEETINWTLDKLILNLLNERKAINEGKSLEH